MLYESDFLEILRLSGLNKNAAAVWLGVSPRTIERYISQGAPLMAMRALHMQSGTFPGWRGFKIRGQFIHSPNGQICNREQIANLSWLIQNAESIGFQRGVKSLQPCQLRLIG